MFTIYRKTLAVTTLALALGAVSTAALADTRWEKDHPRREQVNDRLGNQNARIDQKVANGEMSKREANKLHTEDHQIRQEERAMASQNGGHITKQEQKTLNQQENAVSRQIKNH